MDDCLFCRIVRGEIPARKVFEDDDILVFHDINPARPLHVLAIPKRHIASLAEVSEADAPLLKFAAVYLRSSLARYFLMMRGWKMLCERNGIHLTDVDAFPFFAPEDAPDPDAAATALASVTGYVDRLRGQDELLQRV